MTKGSKFNRTLGVLISILLLFVFVSSFSVFDFNSVHVSGAQSPINFVGAVWVNGGAIPGDIAARLNVTIQNLNPTPIFGVREELNLSSSSLLNATNGDTATAVVQGSVQPGGIGAAVFTLNIAPSGNSSGPIYVPLVVNYENGTVENTQILSIPVSIDQPLPLTILSTGWSGSSNGTVLAIGSGGAQGDLEDFFILQVLNPNPFSINSLTGTIGYNIDNLYNSTGGNTSSYSSSSPSVVSPNAEATLSFPVNISPNATIGPVQITVSLSYKDSVFRTLSQTNVTTAQIYGASIVSLKQISSVIDAGQTSPISFVVTNTGTSPMYTPALTLSLRTGMIVTGNATSPARNPTINPGGSTIFSFNITTASNFPVGTYHASALVFYNNQFGTKERAAFSTSVLVAGTISLSFQSVHVVQNYNNVTVVANVINYGTSGANLTKAIAYLSTEPNGNKSAPTLLSTTNSYIGTISPLAPSYFTLILPYTTTNVPLTANLTLVLSYQNGTGASLQSTNMTVVSLLPSSQISQPPGMSQNLVIVGGIVIVIVVVLLVGYLYMKRRRI